MSDKKVKVRFSLGLSEQQWKMVSKALAEICEDGEFNPDEPQNRNWALRHIVYAACRALLAHGGKARKDLPWPPAFDVRAETEDETRERIGRDVQVSCGLERLATASFEWRKRYN